VTLLVIRLKKMRSLFTTDQGRTIPESKSIKSTIGFQLSGVTGNSWGGGHRTHISVLVMEDLDGKAVKFKGCLLGLRSHNQCSCG
jgi:hypothetical protein